MKLDAWTYWKENGLHVNVRYEVISQVHQMPVVQHYLMMEDAGDST